MARYGTRCPLCSKTYASARWLSNHITKVHPEKNLREFTSQKRHLSDVDSSDEMPGESTCQGQDEMLEFNMDIIFKSSTREGQDEGSDREVLDFSSDESDRECPSVDEVIQRAGAPIECIHSQNMIRATICMHHLVIQSIIDLRAISLLQRHLNRRLIIFLKITS